MKYEGVKLNTQIATRSLLKSISLEDVCYSNLNSLFFSITFCVHTLFVYTTFVFTHYCFTPR